MVSSICHAEKGLLLPRLINFLKNFSIIDLKKRNIRMVLVILSKAYESMILSFPASILKAYINNTHKEEMEPHPISF